MTKEEARARGRAERERLDAAERAEKDRQIRERLWDSPLWQTAECVLLYLSFGTEVGTWEIARRAVAEDKALYCPRVEDARGGRMEFYRTDLARTKPGVWGIREPVGDEAFPCPAEDAERVLIVLPGVAFSEHGARIGYGGGFYDRYLAGRPDLMNRVALCYDGQVMTENEAGGAAFPAEETDERVAWIVTESRTIVCGGRWSTVCKATVSGWTGAASGTR